MKTGGFDFNERNFLKLEEMLSAQRPASNELYSHRVSLFCRLADVAYAPKEKKFKFGLASYYTWLLWKLLTSRPARVGAPPPADFLVHIVGDVSKEVDTLAPVVAALRRSGHSVLVLWGFGGPVPEKIASRLNGATIWTIPDLATGRSARIFHAAEVFETFRQLRRAFRFLRPLPEARRAFRKSSSWWFHDFLLMKSWERWLGDALAEHRFKGVAVVSESAASTQALCRVARKHGWPAHHFLHGLPGFMHTHTIASDIHCFGECDRNFFIRAGHPPERTHANGHPRQAGLAGAIRALRNQSPEEGGLRILFASQPAWSESQSDMDNYRLSVETVSNAANQLSLAPAEFRARLHPVEDRQTYLEIARRCAPTLAASTISSHSVAEDLAWANVVLTPFSTMSMEAVYAGCLLFWLPTGGFHYEIAEELIERGYGLRVNSAGELAQQLANCRNPTARAGLIAGQTARAHALKILNPEAATAAAACMADMQDKQRNLK